MFFIGDSSEKGSSIITPGENFVSNIAWANLSNSSNSLSQLLMVLMPSSLKPVKGINMSSNMWTKFQQDVLLIKIVHFNAPQLALIFINFPIRVIMMSVMQSNNSENWSNGWEVYKHNAKNLQVHLPVTLWSFYTVTISDGKNQISIGKPQFIRNFLHLPIVQQGNLTWNKNNKVS